MRRKLISFNIIRCQARGCAKLLIDALTRSTTALVRVEYWAHAALVTHTRRKRHIELEFACGGNGRCLSDTTLKLRLLKKNALFAGLQTMRSRRDLMRQKQTNHAAATR